MQEQQGRSFATAQNAQWTDLLPLDTTATRKAIEQALGRPFHLTRDLEQAMPSFKGSLALDEERAVWSAT